MLVYGDIRHNEYEASCWVGAGGWFGFWMDGWFGLISVVVWCCGCIFA